MSLDKLKREAEEKFSEKEINDFINMGRILAGKPVHYLLMEVIKECANLKKGNRVEINAECDRICKKLKKTCPYDYCGFTQCEFDNIDYKLNITLSIVDKDYRTDIAIPDEKYINDLVKQYGLLKEMAHAYLVQFINDNKTLFERLSAFCGSMDLSKLTVPEDNPTTMYFDKDISKRIGIFAYYVDSNGNPLRKK